MSTAGTTRNGPSIQGFLKIVYVVLHRISFVAQSMRLRLKLYPLSNIKDSVPILYVGPRNVPIDLEVETETYKSIPRVPS